jgi:hypothetical protein
VRKFVNYLVHYLVHYHANYLVNGECSGCGVAVHPGRAVHRNPDRDR